MWSAANTERTHYYARVMDSRVEFRLVKAFAGWEVHLIAPPRFPLIIAYHLVGAGSEEQLLRDASHAVLLYFERSLIPIREDARLPAAGPPLGPTVWDRLGGEDGTPSDMPST